MLLATLAAVLAAPAPSPASPAARHAPAERQVRVWQIRYLAHDRVPRKAYVFLPAWYGPKRHPRIPLVVSPHGRGVRARANLALWGALPARGRFAVISPDGEGRRLSFYSWGSPGQIGDLARMPQIARLTLPWLRIDPRRIYAFGGSMGGQETLLLLAKHPRLLAGAAAFDSVTNLARQYRSFPRIPCGERCRRARRQPAGRSLQALARAEVGGTPRARPAAYRQRSPFTYARAIARSCVPLQLWWSRKDRIVPNQSRQSGALFVRIRRLNPAAPVQAFVGWWRHSAEMRATARLPAALEAFGLLPPSRTRLRTAGVRVVPGEAPSAQACRRRGV